jgi:hypothetical protein
MMNFAFRGQFMPDSRIARQSAIGRRSNATVLSVRYSAAFFACRRR